MHLLVTRPEPDAMKLAGRLEQDGHDTTVEPLMRLSFEDAEPIDLDGVSALIATSRNALSALRASPALAAARHPPHSRMRPSVPRTPCQSQEALALADVPCLILAPRRLVGARPSTRTLRHAS
jgi:hypothetical protein